MTESAPLKLSLPPGEYGCVWTLPVAGEEDRETFGSLELLADNQPRGTMRGRLPVTYQPAPNGGFYADLPQRLNYVVIHGALHNGLPLALLEAKVQVWGDDQAFVDARAALVGSIPPTGTAEPLFSSIKLQIEHLDSLGGRPPIGKLSYPTSNDPHLSGTWSVQAEPASSQDWSDEEATVSFSFDASTSPLNGYAFHMAFSPVLEVKSASPMPFGQWIDDWVSPLRRIVCLATGRQERITYLAMEPVHEDGSSGLFGSKTRAEVYGTGLTQSPYASNVQDVRNRPSAFTTASAGISLLELARGWRTQVREQHPFIETYGEIVGNRPQHPRSQYLLLLQALEGLYGHETREKREAQEERHVERRKVVMETAAISYLSSDHREFVDKFLSKKPYTGGVEDALRYCLTSLSFDISENLEKSAIVQTMLDQGATSMPDALRRVRNDLAHGNRGYPVQDLHEVATLLERLARAHLLRLLGCPDEVQGRALRPPG
jgi:hypothetical protein